jgi:hypothetical protein
LNSPLQFGPAPSSISNIVQIVDYSPVRVAMISSFRERAKLWIGGAFTMLLLVGGLVPPRAQAGCSHDVTSNISRSFRNSVADLELLQYSAGELEHPLSPSPRKERGCSGPSCSPGQSSPQAPAPSLSLRSDLWCFSTLELARGDRDSTAPFIMSTAPHPRHETSPLERPPRRAQRLSLS